MKAHFSAAILPLAHLPQLGPVAARLGRFLGLGLALGLGLGLAAPAHAVDGCKLLLCMAGDWQNIGACKPIVRQALRDVARGRVWPTCAMSGNSASGNQFIAADQCPAQYITDSGSDESGRAIYSCPFSGVILVVVDGRPWSRTWWSVSGDSVVEWLPAAKAAFATTTAALDDRFESDQAAWALSQQGRSAAGAAGATGQGDGG